MTNKVGAQWAFYYVSAMMQPLCYKTDLTHFPTVATVIQGRKHGLLNLTYIVSQSTTITLTAFEK